MSSAEEIKGKADRSLLSLSLHCQWPAVKIKKKTSGSERPAELCVENFLSQQTNTQLREGEGNKEKCQFME